MHWGKKQLFYEHNHPREGLTYGKTFFDMHMIIDGDPI